ncbi:MAG TPA: RIP metalloprotease RseP [Gammaproteobacteria bacterium]|nr:RIP metalloprotease RseP [Gammaproteobacteria bacterium]
MDILSSILAFIVAIGVLVAFHEFGHFWVARRLGMKVLRFSIGFGKPLAKLRGRAPDNTEYWLSAIPLGGYVKLLDEREAPVPDAERSRAFNNRPPLHRIAVLFAGPGFNFVFAILAYWLMFIVGVPSLKPYIGDVVPGSIAAEGGLAAGDEIRKVGGVETETLEDATLAILDELLDDGRIPMTVVGRNGETRRVELDARGKVGELSEPDALFPGLGLELGPVMPPVIGTLLPGGPAAEAGLEVGDRVVALNGERVGSFDVLSRLIKQHPNETVTLRVERGGAELDIPVQVRTIEQEGRTYPGIGVGASEEASRELRSLATRLLTEQRYGVGQALVHGAQKTWEVSALTVRMLGRMVIGEVSVRNLSGPIAIATYAGDSAQAGIGAFLSFLALISVSLGLLNLLPVPILDGGQIVYQVVEWVKGEPLSERTLIVGQQIGLWLLIVLMGFVFYNDLTRVFS